MSGGGTRQRRCTTAPATWVPAAVPVDVGRSTVRVAESLRGVHPKLLSRPRAEVVQVPAADACRVVRFRWGGGLPTTLSVEAGSEPWSATAPLMHIAQAFGDATIRDLLALFFFARLAGDRAGPWWWWPAEHLEAIGQSGSQENVRALYSRMRRLGQTMLEVRFPAGRPLVGPVVACTLTDGRAWRLALHDALFAGVRQPSTHRHGTAWWALPATLLRMPADGTAGRIHLFAIIAGQMFRAGLRGSKVAEPAIGMARLTTRLGLRPRYLRDPRTAGTVVRTLDAAVQAGVIADWHAEGGDVADGSAALRLEPGPAAVALLEGRRLPTPGRVPSTGSELADWIARAGLGMAEAGDVLGCTVRTVERAVGLGDRPLPYHVRQAARMPPSSRAASTRIQDASRLEDGSGGGSNATKSRGCLSEMRQKVGGACLRIGAQPHAQQAFPGDPLRGSNTLKGVEGDSPVVVAPAPGPVIVADRRRDDLPAGGNDHVA